MYVVMWRNVQMLLGTYPFLDLFDIHNVLVEEWPGVHQHHYDKINREIPSYWPVLIDERKRKKLEFIIEIQNHKINLLYIFGSEDAANKR